MRICIFFVFCLFSGLLSTAQNCTAPGQNPGTAFPVCGNIPFTQTTVPLCGGKKLPAIHCSDDVTDVNPFWYKFTCYQSGTLGFVITPKVLQEDYDWELYDVTGVDVNTVYTNGNLAIASNWSGELGVTGASAAGTNLFECAGGGVALFSKMPMLQAGHNYLLLISHFTPTQSGYTLQFTTGVPGAANIIDPNVIPRMQKADVNCSGQVIHLKLNKKIKCASIATNGSDFSITPSNASIIAATGFECGIKFDTDSMDVQLDHPLPPGNYTLQVKIGSDNNTLLDPCDNAMPVTETATFTVPPPNPTPMDSLTKVGCSPNTLQLVFSKPIVCSSIAADGSDFIVTGNYPVTVSSATGVCTNGKTTAVTVTLSQAMMVAGNFRIELRRGSDGNTLLDECAGETPVGSFIPFSVKDTVNADFTYNVQYGCSLDVVNFFHPGNGGVNTWRWKLGDGFTSTLQSPQANYTNFSTKTIELFVSNGVCHDSTTTTFVLDNYLTADFTVYPDNCPQEPIPFTAMSTGKIKRHDWDFGDGQTGTGAIATHIYARPQRETTYNVRYTVTDSFGCSKMVQKPVKVYNSCTVAVPNAFTPGRATNNVLYPLNAIKADQLEFTVYNRWGQMIFRTTNWKAGWDGSLNGIAQPSGTYVWLLRYTDRDSGKKIERKGFAVLIR